MFSFVARNLSFLKSVPFLPVVFDSLLRTWYFFAKPQLLQWLDEIEKEVLSWNGTGVTVHKYGGMQFNYLGKEIGHIHSNGLLDMLFSRGKKQELLAEGRITPHHIFSDSGWISFQLETAGDKEYAIKLLYMEYMNRNK